MWGGGDPESPEEPKGFCLGYQEEKLVGILCHTEVPDTDRASKSPDLPEQAKLLRKHRLKTSLLEQNAVP